MDVHISHQRLFAFLTIPQLGPAQRYTGLDEFEVIRSTRSTILSKTLESAQKAGEEKVLSFRAGLAARNLPFRGPQMQIPRALKPLGMTRAGRIGSLKSVLLINQIFLANLHEFLQPLLPVLRDAPRVFVLGNRIKGRLVG